MPDGPHLETTVRPLGVPAREPNPDAAPWRREAVFVAVALAASSAASSRSGRAGPS